MSDNQSPKWPPCEGKHYADSPQGPTYLGVHYGEFNNEIAEDKPMHENSTPEMGGFAFSEGHYDDSPGKGGFGSYGVAVGKMEPSREKQDTDGEHANRGKES